MNYYQNQKHNLQNVYSHENVNVDIYCISTTVVEKIMFTCKILKAFGELVLVSVRSKNSIILSSLKCIRQIRNEKCTRD